MIAYGNEREIELAFAALESIKADKSTKGKTAILLENKDNNVLRNLLYYAFNTFLQYYIKQIPVVEPANRPIQAENFKTFLTLLDNLNDRKIKNVKGAVAEFLCSCNAQEQMWYTRVLLRDLSLGLRRKASTRHTEASFPYMTCSWRKP